MYSKFNFAAESLWNSLIGREARMRCGNNIAEHKTEKRERIQQRTKLHPIHLFSSLVI